MARATVQKELHFEIANETGVLGQISKTLELQGIFIIHLSAYSVAKKSYFQLLVKDTAKAKTALKHLAPKVEERDVLVVEFENKTGTLSPVARLLGSNRIDVKYVYGTSGDGFKIVGVFSTSDNAKAAKMINEDSGALGV